VSDGPSAPRWARAAAVLLGAALYALSLPPWDWACLGWVALVPLLLIVREEPAPWAFRYGMLYGVACAWAVGPWLPQAMAHYFGLGLPLGVVAGTLYGVAFWGTGFGVFAAGAAVLLGSRGPLASGLAVPALWVATEFVRGRFLGQPWGLLGYTQHAQTALIQIAALTAVYGVSFLLAFGNMAIAESIALLRARADRRRILATLALPVMLVAPLWLAGAIVAERGPVGGFAARPVAVVQTNLAPAFEWTRAYTDREVMAHLQALDQLPHTTRPALIVWPEHAVPRYLEDEPMLGAQLGAVAAQRGADLLFGAPRYEAGRTYNSARLITAAGRNGGYYDKQRLVLGAEANPFLSSAGSGPDESPRQFSTGSAPGVLRTFVPIGVSICHEILFPELVARAVGEGAELLVNISNDGWLDGGHGLASRQHFAMAAFRAVETRRYLVRAATTGVSGFVDPYGRVVSTLAPGVTGVLTASVAGRSAITPYVRIGDAFAFACLLAAMSALHARRAAVVRPHRRLAVAPPAP